MKFNTLDRQTMDGYVQCIYEDGSSECIYMHD